MFLALETVNARVGLDMREKYMHIMSLSFSLAVKENQTKSDHIKN